MDALEVKTCIAMSAGIPTYPATAYYCLSIKIAWREVLLYQSINDYATDAVISSDHFPRTSRRP